MQRLVSRALDRWLTGVARKPLILKGARQVGKTWLVRDLAQRSSRRLVEVNFERDPGLAKHFRWREPGRVLDELGVVLGLRISPERDLLFLDEVQGAREVLPTLRWFAEELPSLAIVAAGSLLDFVLKEHAFSMPVGRVSYCTVGPMTFPEFLDAHGEELLHSRLAAWLPRLEWSPAAHERAREWFARYLMVGGMPAVVAADVAGAEAEDVRRVQRDLLTSYRDDFAKYTGRMGPRVLDQVLVAVVASLGQKLVYTRLGEGVKNHQAKRAIELLEDARLCRIIRYSSASGLPLAAHGKDTFRKAVLLDVGLLHPIVRTPAGQRFLAWSTLSAQARGQLVEQAAAQQLAATADDPCEEMPLYYWQREGGRPGEVDLVVQLGQRIVPVELKAGAAGAMKSLHQFMVDKQLNLAVRLDSNAASLQDLDVKTTQGERAQYRLLSLPHHLAWRLPAIVASL